MLQRLIIIAAAGLTPAAATADSGFFARVDAGVTAATDHTHVGDFDGDGRDDVLAVGEDIVFRRNTGELSFEDVTLASSVRAHDSALGNLSGGASPDLVTVSVATRSIFIGIDFDGAQFASTSVHSLDDEPAAVAIMDVNGDGMAEIVLATAAPARLVTYAADGNALVASENLPGGPARQLLPADLDGDGAANELLALIPQDGVVGVWSGDPPAFSTLASFGGDPRCMDAADVNDDGLADVVVGDFYNDMAHVLINDGVGGFQLSEALATSQGPAQIHLADLSGDGLPEILLYGIIDRRIQTWTNDGSGGYCRLSVARSEEGVHGFTVIDGDDDGDADLLQFNPFSGWTMTLGRGGGDFGMGMIDFGREVCALAVSDFDGDGVQEFAACYSDLLWVGEHEDGGVHVQYTAPVVLGEPTFAQVDGDGLEDLIVRTEDGVSIAFNDGAGGFSPLSHAISADFREHRIGDLDQDGQADVLLRTIVPDTIVLFLNRPSARGGVTFEKVAFPGLEEVQAIAIGDMNSDGFADIVYSRDAGPDEFIGFLPGSDDGAFGDPVESEVDRDLRWMDATDFDGDGDDDVIGDTTFFRYYENVGDGVLVRRGALGAPSEEFALFSDLDLDGDEDCILFSRSTVRVYRNTGTIPMTFDSLYEIDDFVDMPSSAVADLNGDLAPDIIIPTRLNDAVEIQFNPFIRCPGDADGDRDADIDDLNVILDAWGDTTAPGVGPDVSADGIVDFTDLNILLDQWGESCNP